MTQPILTKPSAEEALKKLKARAEQVRDMIDIQKRSCPMDDEYCRGMANGLIAAVSVLFDETPDYVGSAMSKIWAR